MGSGCTSPTCEETLTCGPFTGGTPTVCIPSANPDVAISDECGVFVSDSLGDDSVGDGTKDKPFKTLGTAVLRAKAVYACNETFTEAVVLNGSAKLYGGLDCSREWVYGGDTARTTIDAGWGEIPIALGAGGTIKVENV